MQNVSRHVRVSHIDTWRFFAVLMVVLGHIAAYSRLSFLSAVVPGLSRFGRLSNTGVLIFFVISGFVISRALLAESRVSGGVSLRAFYTRRAFRILPPLWLYLCAIGALTWASILEIAPWELAAGAAFVVNVSIRLGAQVEWNLVHLWSLGFEEQFYLIFPVIAVGASFTINRARVVIVWLGVLAGSVLTLRLESSALHYFFLHFSFLLTGCACAMYEERLLPLLQRLHAGLWAVLGLLLAGCAAFAPVEVERFLKPVIYPPLIAMLVLGTPLRVSAVRTVFHCPLLVYLGTISYSVYLWQQLAANKWEQLSPVDAGLLCLGVWLFAHCSWQYFERPLIAIGKRWSDHLQLSMTGRMGVRV